MHCVGDKRMVIVYTVRAHLIERGESLCAGWAKKKW